MKTTRFIFLASCIILYTLISRLWHLNDLPQASQNAFLLRLLSANAGIVSVLGVAALSYLFSYSIKVALLAALIFSITPWSIEQSRITSLVNIALPGFLTLQIIAEAVEKKPLKVALFLLQIIVLTAVFLSVYPQSIGLEKAGLLQVTENFFTVISPEYFFVKNPSYWWGGIKEFGILFLSFAPFVYGGMLLSAIKKTYMPLIWTVTLAVFASLNPVFPEGRQFYFALPSLCFLTALGINSIKINGSHWRLGILLCILAFVVYEMFQYWHYYMVHYPQEIMANFPKIKGTF